MKTCSTNWPIPRYSVVHLLQSYLTNRGQYSRTRSVPRIHEQSADVSGSHIGSLRQGGDVPLQLLVPKTSGLNDTASVGHYSGWLQKWRVAINTDKAEEICFKRKSTSKCQSLSFDGRPVLDVRLDGYLNFNNLVTDTL